MGAFFERYYMRGMTAPKYETQIGKASKDIGYTISAKSKGVPISAICSTENAEWILLDSPLLEPGNADAERFARALSREFNAPILHISCVDSDFALCRLINADGSESIACINEPYEGFELPPAEPAAWVAASKKKWKCREEQFEEIFSGKYVFAEDGLEKLYELIRLPQILTYPESGESPEVSSCEFRLIPEDECEAVPAPPTLAERLAAHIDKAYSDKLIGLGFRRFGGSSLRWHKVFGEEGKELISSIVFSIQHGSLINIFFGCQAVCCPLVLSDKYYSLHDNFDYLADAFYEFYNLKGYSPRFGNDSRDTFQFIDEPERIDPYMNELILELLGPVTDIDSMLRFEKILSDKSSVAEQKFYSYNSAYRMFVEALLADEKTDVQKSAAKVFRKHHEMLECFPEDRKGASAQLIVELPQLYIKSGASACLGALKKVRDANMKKLERGGIV